MEFSEHPSHQIQPPQFERVSTGKTRRYLVAAALVGGGVTLGAVFSPIGLAGAQTGDEETDSVGAAQDSDDESTTDDEATDEESTDDESSDDKDGDRNGRRHRRLEGLTEILGLSSDELRERLSSGMTLAEVAEEQGISSDELVDEMVAAVTERVNEAVAEDRIDADRAAERLANVEEKIEERINREFGERSHRGGNGRSGVNFGEVIEGLGVTDEALEAGRADGKTLAEVAGEQGVSEQDLVDALVAEATESIDEALAEGKIDAERAEELKASLGDRVSERVNSALGERDGKGRGGHRGHHRGNRSGDSASDTDTDGETEGTSYSA